MHIVHLKPPGKRGFACDAMIQTVLRRDIVHLNVTKVNSCKCSVTYGIIAWHALVNAITSRVPSHSNDRLPMFANVMQEHLLPGMHSLYQLEFAPSSIRYHVALQRAISVSLQGC